MDKITELNKHIQAADAILVGGGSGMSNAAGMDFWYKASPLFLKYFKPFYDKYHFEGAFQGYYQRFDSQEEFWAFRALLAKVIYTVPPQKPTYEYLKKLSLTINLFITSLQIRMVFLRDFLVKTKSVKFKALGNISKVLILKMINIFIRQNQSMKKCSRI